jgi:hypothetical protein
VLTDNIIKKNKFNKQNVLWKNITAKSTEYGILSTEIPKIKYRKFAAIILSHFWGFLNFRRLQFRLERKRKFLSVEISLGAKT